MTINNNYNNINSESDIETILENYNFKEKTLINLINILNLFKQYNQFEIIRFKCIVYFNEYHDNKYFSYINFQDYCEFIKDIFFDNSFKVFEELKNLNSFQNYDFNSVDISGLILSKLFNEITFDKRFNEWFQNHYENNLDLLKIKIDIIKSYDSFKTVQFNKKENKWNQIGLDEMFDEVPIIDESAFNMKNLYDIVYKKDNNNNDNNKKKRNNKINRNNKNNNTKENNENKENKENIIINQDYSNSNNKIFNFSDLIIRNIINNLINTSTSNKNHYCNLLKLSLVSKQFLKITIKLLNNSIVKWDKLLFQSIIPSKINKQYCLIQKMPLEFDYIQIKYIPFYKNNYTTNDINILFSNIETISICSIEGQEIYEQIEEDNQDNDQLDFKHYKGLKESGNYQTSDSLVLLPSKSLLSLKNLILTNHTAQTFSYNTLLENIITNCNNNSIINFNLSTQSLLGINYSFLFSFLDKLLFNHLNSLKYIKISLIDDDSINDILNILIKFKNDLNNIVIDFIDYFGSNIKYYIDNIDELIKNDDHKQLLLKINNNNNNLLNNNNRKKQKNK